MEWKQVRVGMVVKTPCDEFFPADMVLIRSAEPKGLCYVETKNLDGETNLKHKVAEKYLNSKLQNLELLDKHIEGTVICEVPNDQIYKFEGSLVLNHFAKKVSLNSENLLLRGSSLRNTEWVMGFVVYAGHQTKIMMNSANSKYKMSTLEKGTNKQIILIFIVQIIMCLLSSMVGIIWQKSLPEGKEGYLDFDSGAAANWNTQIILMLIKQTGTWVLIFT
jgi:magnesium-transporting ATPase (P-type)